MNSGKPNNNKGSSSLNNFNFDFDLGSNFSNKNTPQPLNSQNKPKPATSSTTSTWTGNNNNNKASWTHQSSSSIRSELLTHTSMVGDIHGKSWATKTPSNNTSSNIGIAQKNPNLFSDLLGSALGQSKNSGNVPLKNAAPVSVGAAKGGSYSMGNLANALPKTGGAVPLKSGGNWGSTENVKSVGGVSMNSSVGLGTVKKDPFGSLADFESKKDQGVKGSSNGGKKSDDNLFGDFKNAGTSNVSSSQFTSINNDFVGGNVSSSTKNDSFEDFMGGNMSSSSKNDSFRNFGSVPVQPSTQSKGVDPLDALFSSTSGSTNAGQVKSDGGGHEMFSEMADWDVAPEFGGGDVGTTTELEGLPPPPAGMTASSAKNKGLDSYKQGQHADAIKWLSWAVVLLENASDSSSTTEVLSSRASCYKEVGEYKKAIADCTKVLEHDGANVSVLLQRALLYESTEKYKLGAEDLRTVMKIDPGNRLARSIIHRLLQLAN
ncbi:hypothetical protein IFM89_022760 [Coptis chinensis]|uniref:Uncharacterized protein n=1 Tax=Coptis chinensis TaxID=261450 RepID=A0A835M6I7_9MAGN|nr:hypothetical protein IFM89_022760 [Coptis chinensis]